MSVAHKSHKLRFVLMMLAAVVMVGVVGWLIYSQNHLIQLLNGKADKQVVKIDELQTEKAKLQTENAQLASKNSNLTKSIEALESARKSTAAVVETGVTVEEQKPSASIKVTSAQVLNSAYFGNTGSANKDPLRFVFFTIKNLSSTTQTYDPQQFRAITDTGELVSPLIFASGGAGIPWYRAELQAGGSSNGYVIFDVDKKIVALQWTPPESQPINVSIPTDQQ